MFPYTSVHLVHISLHIYHQAPEGTTRCYCPCPALPAPHLTAHGPRSPVSAHPAVISPCPSHIAGVPVSNPLSGPVSQKDLGFSLQVAHLLGASSGTYLLLPLAGAPGWPLALAHRLPCLWLSMRLLPACGAAHPVQALWVCPPWRGHSLWWDHTWPLAPCPSGSCQPLLHS